MDANITTPTRQALAARDRSLPGQVTGRLKRALDIMVWEAAKRADAAKTVGMTDHSMRQAMKRPHVMAYFTAELRVRRESGRAKTLARLEELRDQDNNKAAAVKACQVLEQVADDPYRGGARVPTVPGLVIVIEQRTPHASAGLTIEAETASAETHDEPTR